MIGKGAERRLLFTESKTFLSKICISTQIAVCQTLISMHIVVYVHILYTPYHILNVYIYIYIIIYLLVYMLSWHEDICCPRCSHHPKLHFCFRNRKCLWRCWCRSKETTGLEASSAYLPIHPAVPKDAGSWERCTMDVFICHMYSHVTYIIIYPYSKTDQLLACPLFRPKTPTKLWKGRKGQKDWSAIIAISHGAPAKPRSPKAMPRSPAWCSREACPWPNESNQNMQRIYILHRYTHVDTCHKCVCKCIYIRI